MQHKLILCCLTLLFPGLLIGQVLKEINKDVGGLPDPDKYPFEIYFKIGLPAGSFRYETGYENVNQILEDGGFDMPKIRQMNIFEVGLRFKRFYLEIGANNEFVNSPIPVFFNDRFSVNSSYIMGGGNIGYSVWQNRNSALILRLGAGSVGSSYDVRSLENISPVDFDNLLIEDSPNSSSLIYHEDIFLDISIEWWKGRAKSRTSFGEAIRLGYRRGIKETVWEAPNTTSLNAPLDRMGEVYLNICFHLGYAFPSKSK